VLVDLTICAVVVAQDMPGEKSHKLQLTGEGKGGGGGVCNRLQQSAYPENMERA
jgi:hypothetical protein